MKFDEIINILSSFTSISIFQQLKSHVQESNIDIDYEYELAQKESRIKNLREQLKGFQEDDMMSSISKSSALSDERTLEVAIRREKIGVIRTILTKDPSLINKRICRNETPFHLASVTCNLTILQFLIQSGADINYTNEEGSALHRISFTSFEERALDCLKYLIKRGVKIGLLNSAKFLLFCFVFFQT